MKESIKVIRARRIKRARSVRAKLRGVSSRPRMSVFFSHAHALVQFIDDAKGKTILAVSDIILNRGKKGHLTEVQAREFGKKVASAAQEKGITQVIFDRGSHSYHGRMKALAEGAREGGLIF